MDGALELAGGLLLLLLSAAQIRGTILFLVQGELAEDPTDFVANLLLHNTSNVIRSKLPASAFLILHGAVKLALVAGLTTERLWAYPAAIVVFAGFAVYQLAQLTQHLSLFLGAVTVLDLAVVLLILAEYRHVRSSRRGPA